jgi:hypothetical protein
VQGPVWYGLSSTVGVLNANAVAYCRLIAQKDAATGPTAEGVVWQAKLFERMGIPLSPHEKRVRLKDLQRRVQQSDSRKTVAGKFKKMTFKLKRIQVGKDRATASKTNGFAGMEYGESKLAARANESYLHMPAQMVLVIVDCETAGCSVYDDTIVELAATSA